MVILPARNEGPRVGAVVRSIREQLPGTAVVVVENGSNDDTAAAAAAAGACVLHSERGYALALQVGFRHARELGAPWVATMDADGQHPASALPRLLDALGRADLVVGSRFLDSPGYPVPIARRAAIAALGHWAALLCGTSFTDVTSGMRAMLPRAFHAFADDYPADVADANVLVRAVRAGWRVAEVPVAMGPRLGGRSMHDTPRSALFALRMAQLCAVEARRRHP